jgi:hypothetical protein
MKYFFTPLIGFLVTLFGLTAPVYMLFLLPFIRWDNEKTYAKPSGADDPFDSSLVIRGDLPSWLKWAQTGDSRFPAGMYEPAMRESLGDGSLLRRLWTSYQWCGLRNRAQGLAFMLGKPAVWYVPGEDEIVQTNYWSNHHFDRPTDGVWKHIHKIGNLAVSTGWQVYRKNDGAFWAVPLFTIRVVKP